MRQATASSITRGTLLTYAAGKARALEQAPSSREVDTRRADNDFFLKELSTQPGATAQELRAEGMALIDSGRNWDIVGNVLSVASVVAAGSAVVLGLALGSPLTIPVGTAAAVAALLGSQSKMNGVDDTVEGERFVEQLDAATAQIAEPSTTVS